MRTYPAVLSETDTLDRVLAGASLARYGDGEFNLCLGQGIPCQTYHAGLSARLKNILRQSGACLVGIPNLRSNTPKAPFWMKYETQALPLLTSRLYGSAFVTRPDSAPWIDTAAYWSKVAQLWMDSEVTLVRGSERSLCADDLIGATRVTEIVCPKIHAWADYAEILHCVGRPSRALICLGPTATVMAVDLCAMGVHAIDAGHIGMWFKKHLKGEPMVRTEADKVAG